LSSWRLELDGHGLLLFQQRQQLKGDKRRQNIQAGGNAEGWTNLLVLLLFLLNYETHFSLTISRRLRTALRPEFSSSCSAISVFYLFSIYALPGSPCIVSLSLSLSCHFLFFFPLDLVSTFDT
jgi:hypothetical protein